MKKLLAILSLAFLFSCNQQKEQQKDVVVTNPTMTAQRPLIDTIHFPKPTLGNDGVILPIRFGRGGRPRPKPTPTPTPTPVPVTGSGFSCLFLDFDGANVTSPYWNGGAPFTCASAGMAQTDIDAIVAQVAQYYARWNVVVTQSQATYDSSNVLKRTHCIVTSTSTFYPGGVSGIAYIGSSTWGDGTPCFVFTDRLYFQVGYVQSICGHEAGHTFNLFHQVDYDASCTLVNSYRPGVMMGNGLYTVFPPWTYGTNSQGCSVYQDDVAVLTSLLTLK